VSGGEIDAGTHCPTCGMPFVRHDETISTCLGSYSPPGHDHDPNAAMRAYYCENDHMTGLAVASRCSAAGCDYRGVRHNRPGIKFIEAWPDID